ncbi:MAG: hypothetical protein ABI137_11440 [Antricoccus sp.]
MGWEEVGREIAKASTAPQAPRTHDDFEAWLVALAMTLKTAVEGNGLSLLLWNDDYTQHRREGIPEGIARARRIELLAI